MSVNPITPTPEDLMMLSSYLDDELSVSERKELEQRLSVDEELRAELESLRETVDLVHSLPYLKAPRNFTLDPSIYGSTTKTNNVTFLSRKMVWRLGSVAGVAAAFMLVFAIFILGASNDASDNSGNSQEVSQANDVGNTENRDQTDTVQTTQVAIASSPNIDQDTTTDSGVEEATGINDNEVQSTKATASVFSQTQIPPADGDSGSEAGLDEASQDLDGFATQTLIASFDTTQTADGIFFSSTPERSEPTESPNEISDRQEGEGQSGEEVGRASEFPSSNTDVASTGGAAAVPTMEMTAPPTPSLTPSPLSTASPLPSIAMLPSATVVGYFDDDVSADASPPLPSNQSPEPGAESLGDLPESSTAMEAEDEADNNDTEIDGVFDDEGITTLEETNSDDAILPMAPADPTVILRQIIDAFIEWLLHLVSRFSR